MRLDFNLLWVENQQGLVQSQRERLELLVQKEGFRLQVKFAETVDEAMTSLAADVYSDHVDLVLMDYDLGPGKKGDEGLVEVRQMIPYRDVVFYSSQASDLTKLVLQAGVQGVYCSTRDDLPDTAHGVFATLVKKVIDIDHSRGIVMGTTSDIDHFVMDSLTAAFDKSTPDNQSEALAQVKKDVEKIRARFEEVLSKVEAAKHVSELFDYHAVYTSADRLQLLRKILKANQLHPDKDGSFAQYLNSTMPKRNLLAHVRVEVDGFIRRLVDRKGKEHTSEHMKELRLELLAHHAMFEAISESLLRVEQKGQ